MKRRGSFQPNRRPKRVKEGADRALRSRGFFEVVTDHDIADVPHCSHGPCLLFSKKSGGRFFACAIFRSEEECEFNATLSETGQITVIRGEIAKEKQEKFYYAGLLKKLVKIPKTSQVLYCNDCRDIFQDRHACVCYPIKRSQLKYPTQFLNPLDCQNGEAQFFFSDESLNVVLSAAKSSDCDGVLCIGAPRVFERIRRDKKSFLLDYDNRLARYFLSTQYAQYSMLVDHFYDPNARSKFEKFLKGCSKLVLICDPPFGAFIEALMSTIGKIKKTHQKLRSDAIMKSIIILPMFVGKHVTRQDPAFWMSDYRVTYDNHKAFADRTKSIVRLFTDLEPKNLDLKDVEGYKLCDVCEKYVTEENQHCFKCQACTSVEKGLYHHCDKCKRCVKPTYTHCRDCSRCHLEGRCY